jgi:hypothetical protein
MSIITTEDFTLRYAVSIAFQDDGDKLEECITRYENYYLNQLFGADLLASYSGTIPDEYLDPFTIDYCNTIIESKGIKDMLLCLIWWHYCYDTPTVPTSIGNSVPDIEAGTLSIDYNIFNQGVKTFKNIQYRLEKDGVSLFNGQLLRYKSWL